MNTLIHSVKVFKSGSSLVNRGSQPFTPSHYLVGALVLHGMRQILRIWLRTRCNAPHNSAIARQCVNHGNNKLKPSSCAYSDVTLTASIKCPKPVLKNEKCKRTTVYCTSGLSSKNFFPPVYLMTREGIWVFPQCISSVSYFSVLRQSCATWVYCDSTSRNIGVAQVNFPKYDSCWNNDPYFS